jgi:hypothetical protein
MIPRGTSCYFELLYTGLHAATLQEGGSVTEGTEPGDAGSTAAGGGPLLPNTPGERKSPERTVCHPQLAAANPPRRAHSLGILSAGLQASMLHAELSVRLRLKLRPSCCMPHPHCAHTLMAQRVTCWEDLAHALREVTHFQRQRQCSGSIVWKRN